MGHLGKGATTQCQVLRGPIPAHWPHRRISLAKVGDMELGRGPQYEKDSDELASSLSGGVVKVMLFVLVAVFVVSLLLGVLS